MKRGSRWVLESFGEVRESPSRGNNAKHCPAVDEAMDATDAPALVHLYRFAVDVEVFSIFVSSLHRHIEVSRIWRLTSVKTIDVFCPGSIAQADI